MQFLSDSQLLARQLAIRVHSPLRLVHVPTSPPAAAAAAAAAYARSFGIASREAGCICTSAEDQQEDEMASCMAVA